MRDDTEHRMGLVSWSNYRSYSGVQLGPQSIIEDYCVSGVPLGEHLMVRWRRSSALRLTCVRTR